MHDKGAGPSDAQFEAFRAGRGQRTWRRKDRGSEDARVALGGMPILTLRVDCTFSSSDPT
eukprot:5207633-Pyramimonas_sp.AAC.1